jgi:hypothetical protein
MTAGVIRPYTLVDILGQIADANGTNNGQSSLSGPTAPVGVVIEVDESPVIVDAVTAATTTPTAWDQGEWSVFSWG